jgi:hypothetical protein
MTPVLAAPPSETISLTTLGLFQDIGYEVNDNAAGFVLDVATTVAGGTARYVTPGANFNPVIRDQRLPAAVVRSRPSGRLAIDPGVTVKLQNSRIELERGNAQLIAEGHESQPIILTSLNDNRFGAGYQFDTNGNQNDLYNRANPAAFDPDSNIGQWGGIVVNAAASASIDNAHITFAGGIVPIEGGFASFNPIEVHRGALRLANSRLEFNASGNASSDRNGRGSNDGATVFVRSAQPIVVGNDFRRNEGSVISINANSMNDSELGDVGRQSGSIARYEQYDDNHGPLIRENKISYVNSATSGTQQPSEFDIELVFDTALEDGSPVSEKIKQAARDAAARWEQVIIGDLANVGAIDDLQITVQADLLSFQDSGPSDGLDGTVLIDLYTQFLSTLTTFLNTQPQQMMMILQQVLFRHISELLTLT